MPIIKINRKITYKIIIRFLKKILIFKLFIFERIFFHFFNLVKYKSFYIPKSNCSSTKLFNKKVHILGAGPSINKDIDKIRKISIDGEIFVSNWFALTNLWDELRPTHYIFADPCLWDDNLDGTSFENKKTNLYKKLSKVDWNLNLYIPDTSLRFIKPALEQNLKISFIVYPTKSCYQKNLELRSNLISKRISSPKICNSILVAIWISIMSKSKSIFLYGLDSDAFRHIETDQKTNEVMAGRLHFYDKKYIPEKKKRTKRLYQRFEQFYIMFREYQVISMVAKLKGIKVTNLSSYSMLDNFKRK